MRNRSLAWRAVLLSLLALASSTAVACGSSEPGFDPETFDPLTSVPVQLDVVSPVIREGEPIPVQFTCDGAGEPPLFTWQQPPDGTNAVAVIVDDPDAPRGIFSHWIAFNLDPDDNSMRSVINGAGPAVEGRNDFGDRGYGGPCPPRGQTHEYRFSVFALIAPLELGEDATAQDVLAAMRGLVIGHGVLTAPYTRQ